MAEALSFKNGRLVILNQAKLPFKEEYINCSDINSCYWAVKKLKVRGAPLLGVFAGYAVYTGVKDFSGTKPEFLKRVDKVISVLKKSRPTAVNLFWALDRIRKKVEENSRFSVSKIKKIILEQARAIHKEDIETCRRISLNGLKVIKPEDSILTHCNTGFLAASGQGTALAVIFAAWDKYKNIKVFNTETRPLLQGARLTSWELQKKGVKSTLICDSMAGFLMQKDMVDKVIVGADRIASNGDTANKIGTYTLAVLAKNHNIPFYVAAPFSTFDLSISDGKGIPIEERSPEEVRGFQSKMAALDKTKVWNPAFDITPAGLITAFITDKGLLEPDFKKSIAKLFS